VKTALDAALRTEAARFAFRFACDDCAHFAEGTDARAARCGNGWPVTLRRSAMDASAGATDGVCFCKEFELA
jgi:hypothetical protein